LKQGKDHIALIFLQSLVTCNHYKNVKIKPKHFVTINHFLSASKSVFQCSDSSL